MPDPADTRSTLLERVRDPGDQEAWAAFVAFFHPVICRYARLQGCAADMCQDIAQETLVDLIRLMPTFRYDRGRGRFRSFLYQMAQRRLRNARRRQYRYVALDTAMLGALDAAVEDGAAALDREWQRQVLCEALRRLQERVTPAAFEAFHASMVRAEGAPSICARLGIEANALYQIRHRLSALLREIAVAVESELGDVHG